MINGNLALAKVDAVWIVSRGLNILLSIKYFNGLYMIIFFTVTKWSAAVYLFGYCFMVLALSSAFFILTLKQIKGYYKSTQNWKYRYIVYSI